MRRKENSILKNYDKKFKTASTWIRFMVMVYEGILLIGPIFFSILICSLIKANIFGDGSEGALHPFFVQSLVLVLTAGYFVWGWSNNRVTLPMKTLNLSVVSASGSPVTIGSALIRFSIAVPAIVTGLWLVVALFRKDSLCPQDLLSGTVLIQKVNESTS